MPIHHSKQFLAIAFSLLTATQLLHGSENEVVLKKTVVKTIKIKDFVHARDWKNVSNIIDQDKKGPFYNFRSTIKKSLLNKTNKSKVVISNNNVAGFSSYGYDPYFNGHINKKDFQNEIIYNKKIDDNVYFCTDNTSVHFLMVGTKYRGGESFENLCNDIIQSKNPLYKKNKRARYKIIELIALNNSNVFKKLNKINVFHKKNIEEDFTTKYRIIVDPSKDTFNSITTGEALTQKYQSSFSTILKDEMIQVKSLNNESIVGKVKIAKRRRKRRRRRKPHTPQKKQTPNAKKTLM